MIIHIVKETPQHGIYIKMFTAEWCPPCQRTKKFLLGDNKNDKDILKKNIYISLINDYENNGIYKHIQFLSPEKKKLYYDLGFKNIENIKLKIDCQLSLFLLNFANQIINKENQTLIIYFGILVFLERNLVINLHFVDVDDTINVNIVKQYQFRSIPTFTVDLIGSSFNTAIVPGSFMNYSGLLNLIIKPIIQFIN